MERGRKPHYNAWLWLYSTFSTETGRFLTLRIYTPTSTLNLVFESQETQQGKCYNKCTNTLLSVSLSLRLGVSQCVPGVCCICSMCRLAGGSMWRLHLVSKETGKLHCSLFTSKYWHLFEMFLDSYSNEPRPCCKPQGIWEFFMTKLVSVLTVLDRNRSISYNTAAIKSELIWMNNF